jgi:hypothetical protein
LTIKVVARKGSGRGFGVSLFGAVLGGCAWWSTTAMAQERKREYRLEYRLEAAGVAAAKSAKIKFTLTNRAPDAVRIAVHNTPLGGRIETRMFTIRCNDEKEPLRYEGLLRSSAEPAEATTVQGKIQGSEVLKDAVLLNPGDSRDATVDLATAYSLPQTGSCSVAFTSLINVVELDAAFGQPNYDFTRATGEPLVLQLTSPKE